MAGYEKRTPEGTRDYLSPDCEARERIRRILAEVFQKRGYTPVETPHLEFYDVFRAGEGTLLESLYPVTDYNGRLLVLRPDNTLPVCRVAATRLGAATLPLRLCYQQSVFRRRPFYAGYSDEISQSGIELIGAAGLDSDVEVLSIGIECLRALGVQHQRVEIGHAGIFAALAQALRLDAEQTQEIAAAVETKNIPALESALTKLPKSSESRLLRELPLLFGGSDSIGRAKELCRSPKVCAVLGELEEIYTALRDAGFGDAVRLDLGLAHGQSYYTGIMFRGYTDRSGTYVLSGGRYDETMAHFGRPAPAVGFAINTDELR
ncbi:MAG: ATP phosphoribosyltransferase regulatory subunit [Oscillospiraceae bacterium]|jgi:ATP phosphoribosyltransferase regulatory subunit|nr:ATP phosphoribosyltransferase regulatory subunit [Oscillospiraceae bacterium]